MEQLDAEALVVVDVDDRPGPEPQRRAVWRQPRLRGSAAWAASNSARCAKPEGDVEQALVGDPVARRPRPARAAPCSGPARRACRRPTAASDSRFAPSRPQSASCSGPCRLDAVGHLEPEHLGEEPPRALQVRHREGHRARHRAGSSGRGRSRGWAARGSSSISSISTPSGSRTQTRRAPGLADRLAQRRACRPPRRAPASASRSATANGDRRVADVARSPVRAAASAPGGFGTRTARSGTGPGGRPATSRSRPSAARPGPSRRAGRRTGWCRPPGSSPSTSRYQRWARRRSVTLTAIWERRTRADLRLSAPRVAQSRSRARP